MPAEGAARGGEAGGGAGGTRVRRLRRRTLGRHQERLRCGNVKLSSLVSRDCNLTVKSLTAVYGLVK